MCIKQYEVITKKWLPSILALTEMLISDYLGVVAFFPSLLCVPTELMNLCRGSRRPDGACLLEGKAWRRAERGQRIHQGH